MTENAIVPHWVSKIRSRWSRGFLLASPPKSTARKLLKTYSPLPADGSVTPYCFLPDEGGLKFRHLQALKIAETLTAVDVLLKMEPPQWSRYEYVSFYVDFFLVANSLRIALKCESAVWLLKRNIERLNHAVSELTDTERESLVVKLNNYLYSDKAETVISNLSEEYKCSGKFSPLTEKRTACPYRVCFLHPFGTEELYKNFLFSDFFNQILTRTEFGKKELPEIASTLTGEAFSDLIEADRSSRLKFAENILTVTPDNAYTVAAKLLTMGHIRAYEMAELILPVLEKTPKVIEELISTEHDSVVEFNQLVNRKYLIEECGWEDTMPKEWFDRALSPHTLGEAYRKIVSDRKQKVGSL